MTAPCIISPGIRQGVFDSSSAWTADSSKAQAAIAGGFFDPDLPLQRGVLFAAASTDVTGDQPTWTQTISLQIDGTKPLAIDLYAPPTGEYNAFGTDIMPYVAFSSTADFSKAFTWQASFYLKPGFNRVVIPPSEWTNVGGESWSNTMVRMRFGFPAYSGKAYYQKVYGVRLVTGVQTQPAAVIMAVDTKLSFYLNGLPLMDARGIKGTYVCETNDITYPGDPQNVPGGGRYWHISADLVKDIQARGWTMIENMDPNLYVGEEVYEYDVSYFPPWDYAAMHQQSIDWLESHGIHPDPRFVCPEGWKAPARLLQLLGQQGVSGIVSRWSSWRQSVPLFDVAPYLLPDGFPLSSSYTLAQVKAEVDKAKQAGQTIVIKVYNIDYVDGSVPNWSSSDFAALLDYIQAQGIPTMTLPEWYEFATGEQLPHIAQPDSQPLKDLLDTTPHIVTKATSRRRYVRGTVREGGRAVPAGTSKNVSLKDRTDLIYGSEIGAWLTDGGAAVDPSTPVPQLVKDAGITSVRFAVYDAFTDAVDPTGTPGTIKRSDFDHAIDGIINTLGCVPIIKLLPICRDEINGKIGTIFVPPLSDLGMVLPWHKMVVKQAGPRVRIYESSNELEYDAWRKWGFAGAGAVGVSTAIGHEYAANMPALRKYAREQLGFSIYTVGYVGISGGFEWGNTIQSPRTRACQEFNEALYEDYLAAGKDPDYIPDAISYHAYPLGSDFLGDTSIDDVIAYYDALTTAWRNILLQVWGDTIGSNIKMAVSEWNAGTWNSSVQWPGFLDGRVDTFYTKFLQLLKDRGYWFANQFAIASNPTQMYDMINADGTVRSQYYAFKNFNKT